MINKVDIKFIIKYSIFRPFSCFYVNHYLVIYMLPFLSVSPLLWSVRRTESL